MNGPDDEGNIEACKRARFPSMVQPFSELLEGKCRFLSKRMKRGLWDSVLFCVAGGSLNLL